MEKGEQSEPIWNPEASRRLANGIGTAVLVYGVFWNVRFKNQLAKSTLMRLLEIYVKKTKDFPTVSQS